jgi:hypothetical protein
VISKPLYKACIQAERKLDKKTAGDNILTFTHSLLWIFMGLSTDGAIPFACIAKPRRPGRGRGLLAAPGSPESVIFF